MSAVKYPESGREKQKQGREAAHEGLTDLAWPHVRSFSLSSLPLFIKKNKNGRKNRMRSSGKIFFIFFRFHAFPARISRTVLRIIRTPRGVIARVPLHRAAAPLGQILIEGQLVGKLKPA